MACSLLKSRYDELESEKHETYRLDHNQRAGASRASDF
jgi:hypothetical protein